MENKKYFTKRIFKKYNNAAIREKRNRALKEDFLEGLDEEKVYPIVFYMFHERNEIRVQIYFGDVGSGFLDMTKERYDMLPIAIWNEERQQFDLEDEKEILKRFPYKNREWTEKVVKKPYRKQEKFRREVLEAYNSTCAVCGLHENGLLRAAHIVPVTKGGIDDIANGICLCANHELAFDKGLMKISSDGDVEVKSGELKGIYKKILFPKDKTKWPAKGYLQEKYDMT